MANNSKEILNFLIVDPNSCGQTNINVDKLNISVELKVFDRSKNISISNLTNKPNTNKFTTISFIDTENDNKNKSFLNTHYTELNTQFGKDNPEISALGIESIDINFNTSYVPVVKIKFKDARGKLFERGNQSPYAFLFKIPYPVFYLTIKGYLGQPVTFILHMIKFNSMLDNNTGSFIIDCDFIGYTYAFLSDILMSYIKATPFTSRGRDQIKLINNSGGNFITFRDLENNINKLEELIKNIKKDNKEIKLLGIYDSLVNRLDRIKSTINSSLIDFKNNKNSKFFDNFIFYKYDKLSIPISTYKNEIETYDFQIKEEIITFNGAENNTKYKLDINDYIINSNNSLIFYNDIGVLQFETLTYDEFIKNNKYKNITEDTFNKISTIIKKNKDYISTDNNGYFTNFNKLAIFDFNQVIGNINNEISKIKKQIDNNKNLITLEFSNKIENEIIKNNKLDTSIGNIFRILSSHVDIFMSTISSIGTEAINNYNSNLNNRKTLLKDNPGGHDVFPNYYINKNNNFIESWIGNKYPDLIEVNFINDLYNKMLKSFDNDTNFLTNVGKDTISWYPVNPLDTNVFDNTIENPWKIINNTHADIFAKLLIERMVLFLGYTNKTVSKSDIILMGKSEANEMFFNLKNKQTIVNALNHYRDNDLDSGINKLYDFIKGHNMSVKPIIIQNLTTNPSGVAGLTSNPQTSFINTTSSEILTFKYPDDSSKVYLPIIQNSGDILSKNAPLSIGKNKNSNIIFGSSLVSEDKSNNIDGETFIKIINISDYNVRNNLYHDYGNKDSVIFKGKQKISEFFDYTKFYENRNEIIKTHRPVSENIKTEYDSFILNNNGEYELNDSSLNIINEDDKNKLIIDSRIKLKTIESVIKSPHNRKFNLESTFNSGGINYSLFGSEFYYSQKSDYGKALLFLYSIPLEGMVSTLLVNEDGLLSDRVINFFNKNGGFIKVPYSWILFLGGILYRAEDDNNVIIETLNNTSLIPNNKIGNEHGASQYIGKYGFTFSNSDIDPKNKINKIILDLPISVKDIFKTEFKNWVTSDFVNLKNKLEIFDNNITSDQRLDTWLNLDFHLNNLGNKNLSNLKNSIKDNYRIIKDINELHSLINIKKIDNAKVIGPDEVKKVIKDNNFGSPINFFLELNDSFIGGGADIVRLLFINKIIISSTYRIWEDNSRSETPISFLTKDSNLYLKTFLREIKKLNDNNSKKSLNNEKNQKVFNSVNVDDIKLSLYKNVKSIYDKWISGVDTNVVGTVLTDLFKNFKFINRAHEDISNKLKLSPLGFANNLAVSHNTSFYAFIARILADNNFDFIPLPTYINYTKKEEVARIFEPTSFNNSTAASGPQFICMYIGERSNKLDLSTNKEDNFNDKNDSFTIATRLNDECDLSINNVSEVPLDFVKNNQTNKIPYFLVKYGDQNQSIFKNIKLNQSEFTETNESLEIIQNLSNRNRNGSIGQNLFDIYNNRSYSATIEMLGCAQIQPFMYFQIDNIPMFRGAYTIINTHHHIIPNSMTTSFKGVRIRRVGTKLVDDITVFYNLIGNLNDVNSEGENITTISKTILKDKRINKLKSGSLINKDTEVLKLKFGNPLDGKLMVTSDFAEIRTADNRTHDGIDFRAKSGSNIFASSHGNIVRVRNQISGGGLYIDVKYPIDKDNSLFFRYMHLSFIPNKFLPKGINFKDLDSSVSFNYTEKNLPNIIIKKGDIIAKTGGDPHEKFHGHSSGPHLHMDCREKQYSLSNFKNPKSIIQPLSNKWVYQSKQKNVD